MRFSLRFDIHAADNLRARKVHTQVQVIGRAIDVGIGFLTLASILMLFAEVRHASARCLLASAGIVGIIAGVAAQETARQCAGGDSDRARPTGARRGCRHRRGRVGPGRGDHAHLRRRAYLGRPAANPAARLLHREAVPELDAGIFGAPRQCLRLGRLYSFPVEAGREALKAIIESSPRWDKRFWNLQVTDTDEKAMQLRVLATAANASDAFDLRCEVRERFIAYIQKNHPQSLPRLRAEITQR